MKFSKFADSVVYVQPQSKSLSVGVVVLSTVEILPAKPLNRTANIAQVSLTTQL